MPRCLDCGRVQPRAEVRRLPRPTEIDSHYRCKDRNLCAARRQRDQERRAARTGGADGDGHA
jgi:hypothetical protein